ncbi:MAG: TraR/DksA C4-type zinc finger protein [Burkholderiales bacterium]|nr:TraR/DksA C4-type zinc finger protein [Burkholderiales bacterium]
MAHRPNPYEPTVSTHLTAGQSALLEAALTTRQRELDRRLAEHQGGLSRAEHAREVLNQDSDDISHREADREMDMALNDRELGELGEVSAALRRLHNGSYGQCADCGEGIAFDRLKVEPWALRCVGCESRRETSRRA